MARIVRPSKKKRLNKARKQTRWAPFWTVMKIYGKGRRVHPGRHTTVKRSWRRTKSKAKTKSNKTKKPLHQKTPKKN